MSACKLQACSAASVIGGPVPAAAHPALRVPRTLSCVCAPHAACLAGGPHHVPSAGMLRTRCDRLGGQLGVIAGQRPRQQPGFVRLHACGFCPELCLAGSASAAGLWAVGGEQPLTECTHSAADGCAPPTAPVQASIANTASAACGICCASSATSTTTSGEPHTRTHGCGAAGRPWYSKEGKGSNERPVSLCTCGRELPLDLQKKVGPLPDGFLHYFTSRCVQTDNTLGSPANTLREGPPACSA